MQDSPHPSQKWLYGAVGIVILGLLGIFVAANRVQSAADEAAEETVEQVLRPIEGPGSSVEFLEQGIFVVLAAGDLEVDDVSITRVEDGGDISLIEEFGNGDSAVALRFIIDRQGEYLVEVDHPDVVSITEFGFGARGGLGEALVEAESAESDAIADNATLGWASVAVTLFGLFVALPAAFFKYRKDKREAQVQAYHRRKAEKAARSTPEAD